MTNTPGSDATENIDSGIIEMKDHISKNIDIYSSDKFQSFLDDISNEVKKESSSIILTKDHKGTLKSMEEMIKYNYAFSLIAGEKEKYIRSMEDSNIELETQLTSSIDHNKELLSIINQIIGVTKTTSFGTDDLVRLIQDFKKEIPIFLEGIHSSIKTQVLDDVNLKKRIEEEISGKIKSIREERDQAQEVTSDTLIEIKKVKKNNISLFNQLNELSVLYRDLELSNNSSVAEKNRVTKILKEVQEEILKLHNGEEANFFPFVEGIMMAEKNKEAATARLRLDQVNQTKNKLFYENQELKAGENNLNSELETANKEVQVLKNKHKLEIARIKRQSENQANKDKAEISRLTNLLAGKYYDLNN